MSKLKDFLWVYCVNNNIYQGARSQMLQIIGYAAFCVHLKLKRDYMEVRESKVGIGLQDYVLPWGWLFQRCVNLDAQTQWTELAWGKDKPFTKQWYAWGVTIHQDLSNYKFMIRSPCEVPYYRTPFFSSTGPRICIFNKFPCDADTVDPWNTPWESLTKRTWTEEESSDGPDMAPLE